MERFKTKISSVALIVGLVAHVSLAVPVSNWKLDEPAGTSGVGSAVDSISGFNGTPVGTVNFGAAGANPNTGTSASYNGAGSIDVPFNQSFNPDSFTVAAWAKVSNNSNGVYRSVFTSRGNDTGPGNQGFILYAANDNTWQFWTGNGGAGGSGWSVLPGSAIDNGVWTHLAVTYDNATSTKKLFVNGVEAASAVQGYVPITAASNRDLHIGGGGDSGTSFRFNGQIDDVHILDNTASAADIAALMTAGPSQIISAGKMYSYSRLPKFDGAGTYYLDEPHVQAIGLFDSGDLTDGLTHPSGSDPITPNPSTIVGWGGRSDQLDAEIIIDLEDVYSIDLLRIGTHVWAPFQNGAPDDVTVSFSDTGLGALDFTDSIFASFTAPPTNGHFDLDVSVSGVAARYVKLSFDGGAVLNGSTNKWMLDEITVYGTAIPEPTSFGFISVLALSMMVRRRRAG